QLSFRLKDWNHWNEHLLNGQVRIKGMAQVRVGDRLWWQHEDSPEKRGTDFYVEGVSQEFRAFSGWTTTLEVTRGQRHRDQGQTLSFADLATGVQVAGTPPTLAANDDPAVLEALKRAADRVRVWGASTSTRPPRRRG